MNDIEMEAVNLLQSSPMNASLMLAQKDKSSSLSIAPVSAFIALRLLQCSKFNFYRNQSYQVRANEIHLNEVQVELPN